ncbi:MAG TPA: hypothetical protein VK648_04910 [Gemmatimonadaceae bacterium]|nr:hypothetical protein [Gemmatimonadaceae bacterium]
MMRVRYSRLAAILVSFVAVAAAKPECDAAVLYSFSATTEGSYGGRTEGVALVDGSRWRINYAAHHDEPTVLTAAIGKGSDVISLNSENETWFRLADWNGSALNSMLFGFGPDRKAIKVSGLKVSSTTEGELTRIPFSYRFQTTYSGQRLHCRVWGEIRVRTGPPYPTDLPWKPVALITGLDEVDAALQKILAPLTNSATQFELDVSRRIENGAILTQSTVRKISEPATATVRDSDFEVPKTYRYQEPVIAVPGR